MARGRRLWRSVEASGADEIGPVASLHIRILLSLAMLLHSPQVEDLLQVGPLTIIGVTT